jgi:hypothetical protein
MKTKIRHASEPRNEYGNRARLLFNEIIQVINHSDEDPEIVLAALTNAIGVVIFNIDTDDHLGMIHEHAEMLTDMVAMNEAYDATKQ